MLTDFCRKRAATVLAPREVERLESYLHSLLKEREMPPMTGGYVNWRLISISCDIEYARLRAGRNALRPGFDALVRHLSQNPRAALRPAPRKRGAPRAVVETARGPVCTAKTGDTGKSESAMPKRPTGVPAKKVVEFPAALWDVTVDPVEFHDALDLQMRRHDDSWGHLHRAIVRPGDRINAKTLYSWKTGFRVPRTLDSLDILKRIECRYRLPAGYFQSKLPNRDRAPAGHQLPGVAPSEQRRLAWHLPDDFDSRSAAEREEILTWVRDVIISGSTDYRRFQAAAMKTRYALRFKGLQGKSRAHRAAVHQDAHVDPDLVGRSRVAPARLQQEMADLVRFKTSTLTAVGFQRSGVWGDETASQKIEHLALLFGALAADPEGPVKGLGIPAKALSFGMLVFPSIWDWYIQWREQRRGFYTAWEVDMLRLASAMTRQETGWLRQNASLIDRVEPVDGLLSVHDIQVAKNDWPSACDTFCRYALSRVKEVERVARVHRDPFEPILPILEADNPVGEYRKITEEILKLMPNQRRYPRAAAESVRAFLMMRIGLHLGVRQKNLRQLLYRRRGESPTSERRLIEAKRGELRWSDREAGWEILIPAEAFKNATSSFFSGRPLRLVLPDLGNLYQFIDAYIETHRPALLREAEDPGTFFVKTVKMSSTDAAYGSEAFYDAWRLIVQRYGIYNPYTGRGAIKGLLPHGPHNVRDVLATHILKQTGSYEQASYAIQDTPDTVAKHYGRFLPQDKAALAAEILNKVWQTA
ncbi:hypothetical protein OSH10_05105 [Kaistia defluvii]|nr:hypothetical protein [Kaistia defluvii]MCX5517805.1 hypothetical protein [Kaistia defluvii]